MNDNIETYIDDEKIEKTFKEMEDPMLHWDIVSSKLVKPSDEVLKQREKNHAKSWNLMVECQVCKGRGSLYRDEHNDEPCPNPHCDDGYIILEE